MTGQRSFFHRYNPAVKKEYLFLPAGIMWLGVGIMLCTMAEGWLSHFPHTLLFLISGLIAGLIIYRFGFSNLAKKNINRINLLEGKRCFFSFMTLKSYFIVIFMIALGITLRHSPIPKNWLSLIYNGIGLGLGLSSIHYLVAFVRIRQVK